MGFIDKVFGNNEDYDYTSSMGLKIKHLDGNKTKYVLSGRLAKGCTVVMHNSDEVGRVMKISYKAHFEDRNGSSYENQNQVLSVPADAISDYSHEKNFLFGETKSFIVDNHSKFYASGDVYVSPYNEYEARNYNLERNTKINSDYFEHTFRYMGTNMFFHNLPIHKEIKIPLELADKISEGKDEFGHSQVRFKGSSFGFINGYFSVEKDGVYVFPDILQNGLGMVTKKERKQEIGKWVEEQLALKKEEENKKKKSEKIEKSDEKNKKAKEEIKVVEKYIPSGKYLSDIPKNEIGKFKFERKIPSLKVNIANNDRVNEK